MQQEVLQWLSFMQHLSELQTAAGCRELQEIYKHHQFRSQKSNNKGQARIVFLFGTF